MDWNQIMQGLRENGVTKVTFEFGEKSPIEISVDKNNNIANDECQETGGLEHSDSMDEKKHRKSKNDNIAVLQFKKNNSGWMTLSELSDACGVSKAYLFAFADSNNVPSKKINSVRLINGVDLWVTREQFEKDILVHDGDRKGGVKFFADLLAAYLDKHR